VRTVENHMRAIFAKLGVTTRTRLAARVHETLGGAHASTSSPRGPAIVGSSRGGVAENT
jgi:hypothetical protein